MALAHREACREYRGDPEYDAYHAERFYQAMRALKKQDPADARVEELLAESRDLAVELGRLDKHAILLSQGEEHLQRKQYMMAVAKFLQIEPGSVPYEKALVYTATCKYALGSKQESYDALLDYLEKYVPNEVNAVQETKLRVRKEAMAMGDLLPMLPRVHAQAVRESHLWLEELP